MLNNSEQTANNGHENHENGNEFESKEENGIINKLF